MKWLKLGEKFIDWMEGMKLTKSVTDYKPMEEDNYDDQGKD
jgi:hypothetical protein